MFLNVCIYIRLTVSIVLIIKNNIYEQILDIVDVRICCWERCIRS
jgi:hypothetical protein